MPDVCTWGAPAIAGRERDGRGEGARGLEAPREQMTGGGLRAAPALGLGEVGKSREGEGRRGGRQGKGGEGGRASQET